ncbi:hypothetical protein [Amycolatopsis speibonae]|uniref:Uncharacterized protein n=1 Tax=Amycolatopsis speibonae TaxID=1450224 RepID=A0ABV7NR61_9PSEU
MKLDGYKWRTRISQVRLGGAAYRVIRPARPASHGPLIESWHGAELDVDKVSAREQSNEGPDLDLVLLRHSLQFLLSRWKSVRSRLGAGRRTR